MTTSIRKFVRHVVSLLLATAVVAMLAPQNASAQSVFASDCSLTPKNVFLDNEPVCAFGGSPGGGIFGPPALVCVVPPGGSPADDVTAGGCNAVPVLSSLWEEFLWLPPTVPGNYTIIVVNNQGGIAFDNIVINSSGGAAPTVDVGAIKAAAAASGGPWRTLADWGEYIDEFASSISVAWSVATGDWLSAAVGVAGIITGQPTDYNGAVLDIGGQIISALAGAAGGALRGAGGGPAGPSVHRIVCTRYRRDQRGPCRACSVETGRPAGVPVQQSFTGPDAPGEHCAGQLNGRRGRHGVGADAHAREVPGCRDGSGR